MTDKNKTIENLRREVDQICAGAGTWHDMTRPLDRRGYVPAPPDTRLRPSGSTQTPEERGPFGRWLLRQEDTGLRAKLIKAARADRAFPLDGDPDAVRARLHACRADGDMFEACDEAELDWASY